GVRRGAGGRRGRADPAGVVQTDQRRAADPVARHGRYPPLGLHQRGGLVAAGQQRHGHLERAARLREHRQGLRRAELGWYIARRIAVMVPVFLGATLLIYGMVFLLPGDPLTAIAGDRPLTPAVAAQLRARYHLDDPFLLQYLRYIGGVLHGDLGRAYSGLPVSAVLAHAFPVTIRLALIALVVEAVLGIGFGVISGLRQGGLFDSTVLITGLIIIAIPIFVLGFLAQFVFGVRLGIAPVTVGERASFARLLLPGIVL